MNDINPKPGEVLIWNGNQWESKNIWLTEPERLRKERKEKLNALQSKLQ